MKYLVRSKFSRSLVHKKQRLDMTSVFNLEHLFVKGGRMPLLSLKELDEKSRATVIANFVNKAFSNSYCFKTLIG